MYVCIYVCVYGCLFKNSFLNVANIHAPIIHKRIRGLRNCPWITSQIKRCIQQRNYLLKKARKTNLDEDWLCYRSSRNKVTNEIKKAKKPYNKRLVEENKNDTKTFWKTIKSVLPGVKKDVDTKSIIVNGQLTYDSKIIANGFNTFFSTAISRLLRSVKNIPSVFCNTDVNTPVKQASVKFKFTFVNEQLVATLIKEGGQSPPPPVPLYPASRTFMALKDREAMFV